MAKKRKTPTVKMMLAAREDQVLGKIGEFYDRILKVETNDDFLALLKSLTGYAGRYTKEVAFLHGCVSVAAMRYHEVNVKK